MRATANLSPCFYRTRTYASILSCAQYVIMFNARYVLVRRTMLRCGMVGSAMRTAIKQGRLAHVLAVARSVGAFDQWRARPTPPCPSKFLERAMTPLQVVERGSTTHHILAPLTFR